jgi:hypothetical protein
MHRRESDPQYKGTGGNMILNISKLEGNTSSKLLNWREYHPQNYSGT